MDEDRVNRAGLYRVIWRWHMYAGLIVAPVLVLLAITGGLYLYKIELESAWYGDLVAASSGPPAALSRQQAAVELAFPGATIRQVSLPPAPGRASEWGIETKDGARLTAFVDPATARVNGSIPSGERLMAVIASIHGGDIIAPIGGYLVELVACWALVLVATGLYLWWPRGRRCGVFVPRLGERGRRLLRDLHAVPAMWNAAIMVFLVLSGLPWSTFWGQQLASLGTLSAATAPSPNFESHTEPSPAHAAHDANASRDIPWSIRNAPGVPAGHHDHRAAVVPPGVDDWLAIAAANGIDRAGLRMFLPDPAEGGTVMLSYVPDAAQDQRTINLDPATGEIVRNVGWSDYSPLAQAVEFGTMAHMGRQLGEPNRLLMLAACITLLLTVAMGVLMWWRRRPKDKARSAALPGYATPAGVIAIAIGLGILFPLLGASLVVIALIETIVAALLRRPREATA